MASHHRPARVAEEFRRELSELLTRGLKDPRITGFVTVTGAKMSPDLKEATAYVSVHADEKVRERTLEGLRAAAPFLQRQVARTLGLRYTPHLRIVYDESVERGDRIDRLLREARVPLGQAEGERALRQAQGEREGIDGGSATAANPAEPKDEKP